MNLFPSRTRTTEERPRISFSDNRIGNNMLSRIITRRRQEENQQLDEIIDIDNDIQIFQQNQLRLLNPRTLLSLPKIPTFGP